MRKIYAGIGSRETPDYVQIMMNQMAIVLAAHGFILNSGGARGADRAFQDGATATVIYRPEHVDRFPKWLEHAAKYHPAWDRCSDYAKKLHARNSAIILGVELNTPVDFVVCWTKDGKASGGTGQALRIAYDCDIPIFNLHDTTAAQRLWDWLKERGAL